MRPKITHLLQGGSKYLFVLLQTKVLKEILTKDLGLTVIDCIDPEASISCSDVLFTGTVTILLY